MTMYRLVETTPLQKFKDQNLLVKTFGKIALKIYNSIPKGEYVDVDNLAQELKIDKAELEKILLFMLEKNIIEEKGKEIEDIDREKTVLKESKEKIKSKLLAKGIETSEVKEEPINPIQIHTKEQDILKNEEVTTPPEEVDINESVQETENIAEPKQSLNEKEIEEQSTNEPNIIQADENQEEITIEQPVHEEEIIQPKEDQEELSIEEPHKEETVMNETENTNLDVNESTDVIETPEELNVEDITPPHEEASEDQAYNEEVNLGENIEKSSDISTEPTNEENLEIEPENINNEVKEENKEEELSPAETIINDKFGPKGVKIFRAVDGVKTISEIAKELNVSEQEVNDVLEFSKNIGLVSFEEKKEKPEDLNKMVPLTETEVANVKEIGDPILLIKYTPKDFLTALKLKVTFNLKYARDGRRLLEYLEKRPKTNILSLVRLLNIPYPKLKAMLDFLNKEGVLDYFKMKRNDIKQKLGYDSYVIYKKYGVEGVLFYELIGEDKNIRDIARLIGENDPNKVIEIFSFIHKVLGVSIPINKSMLLKQLTSKEEPHD